MKEMSKNNGQQMHGTNGKSNGNEILKGVVAVAAILVVGGGIIVAGKLALAGIAAVV